MKILRIIGKAKGLFFLLRLDHIVPQKAFMLLAHASKLSKWIRDHREQKYCDYYTFKFDYAKRYGLYEYVINSQKLDTEIDYLEFGVSKGESFKWWIERIKDPNARFYGFDTFSGLPEDWGPFKKGDMHNENEIPRLEGSRHQFFQGLFQQTLLPFLQNYKPSQRRVIHMDADIYSATLYVLTLITPILKKGDILFFDEFNVPMHEFRAFSEWAASFYIDYEVLGSVNNFYQVAFIVK